MSTSMPPLGPTDGKSEMQVHHTIASASAQSATAMNPMYAYPQPTDEIDLVELLGFFWKIKLEIALGLVVGVLGGAFVAFQILPVTYKTQIPLSLDKSEPALPDAKKFVEAFNNTLNSTDTARLVWRSVFNQSPELGRVLKDAELTDESLAARQALSANPEKAPLRLRESASPRDFVLDVSLPVRGLTQRSGDIFAAAIQHALSGTNLSEADKSNATTGIASATVPGAAAATAGAAGSAGGSPLQVQDDYREQLLKLKQEYLKIEFLLNKLSRGLPEYQSFMASADSDLKAMHFTFPPATETTPMLMVEAQEQFVVQAQYERMQRMVALLLAEGRMKAEEAGDTVQRAQQIRDEIFQLIPIARREAAKSVGTSFSSRKNKDGLRSGTSASLLPTLVSASLNGSALTLEEPVSKRKIALVLGAFLGAFAGFAFGGLRVFIQKNGRRLREVVAQ